MTVREAVVADHPALARLGTQAFAAFGDYRGSMSRWLANPGIATLMAEEAGEPLGFAMLALLQEPDGIHGNVLAVCVDPDRRRAGLGATLLDAALDRLGAERERFAMSRIIADVAEDNAPALALFTAAGFIDEGLSGGRYPSGQRVRRLVKPLESSTIPPC